MGEDNLKTGLVHNLILKERNSLMVSGVSDVDSFDDQTIIAYTNLGELTVKGNNLHINKLSIEVGELSLDGEICSMSYTDNKSNNGGLLSKLFR